jgi:Fur family transcriptional regulator, zinc uptake regulator
MAGRKHEPRKLTANDRLVFEALTAARKPLSAYDLIDRLRKDGITAPPTVYRALSRLIGDHRAHKLESLNAFVACRHAHGTHPAAIFAICDDCGDVDELLDGGISAKLARRAAAKAFAVESTTVELHGTCAPCRERAG